MISVKRFLLWVCRDARFFPIFVGLRLSFNHKT
jgi:hypothetical protein